MKKKSIYLQRQCCTAVCASKRDRWWKAEMERLTEQSNVLSWDCGLSNIAYCLVEYINDPEVEFKVRLWETFSLNALREDDAVENLVKELNSRPWMMHVDHVCIESQMHVNHTMKVISHVLQTYFLTRSIMGNQETREELQGAEIITRKGPRVHFVVPQNKFKVCNVPEPGGRPGHARNKRIAILMAKKLLEKQQDRASIEYMNSYKKQDDLADSLLQGVYFLRTLRKKEWATRRINEHIGRREIVIRESSEDDDSSKQKHHVYRSENFTFPTWDISSQNLKEKTTYSRFDVRMTDAAERGEDTE